MESKKALIIGASTKRMRDSNMAIRRLLEHGHSVVGIGKSGGKVLGVEVIDEKIYNNDFNTVSLYINNSIQSEYYDYIVSLNPKRVIFNPGTENPEFYDILKENNIKVEIDCTLILLRTNQY
jgi:predicted CoA-binding protein